MENHFYFEDLNKSEGEEFEENSLEGEEVRGSSDLSLANATGKVIKVKAYVTAVRQDQSAAKEITLGADAGPEVGGGGNIKLKVGSSQYKFGEHLASTDVYPHAREDMALLEVKGLFSLAGKIYAANPVIMVEIEVDGIEKIVVKSVRAGNGLIFSQNSYGDFKVEQARGRKWFRKFQPWLSKNKIDKNPHKDTNVEDCMICN